MKKFAFKTVNPSGKYKSFNKSYHQIYLNKVLVGSIDYESFKIRFMVYKVDIHEDKNPNCKWKWITLKHKPDSLESAKEFIRLHNKNIQEKFNLVKE